MVLPSGDVLNVTDMAQRAQVQQMRAAWDAYRGRFPDPLKVKPGQINDTVKTNRCKPVVDKGVAFLFGQDVTIEVVGDDAAQGYLDSVWKANRQMTLFAKVALNGAVCGHAFAKILPGNPMPRLIALDPQTVTVTTDPDDCEIALAYTIEYPATDASGKSVIKRQVFTRVDPNGTAALVSNQDRDDTWTIAHFIQPAGMRSFIPDGPAQVWPYWWPPIADCQNLTNPNEFWGEADLTPDLIDLNKVLNFIQSNMARILKFHAHPKTIVKGMSAAQLDLGVDGILGIPNPNATIENLEMKGDLHASMNFAESMRTDMDELSRVPAVATGRIQNITSGRISGIALHLLFQPLLEKTRIKQRLYGEMIEELCCRLLDMAGYGYDHTIELHWPHLLPVDDTGEAQKAQIWEALGISQDTVLRSLGFDPEAEAAKRATESPIMPPGGTAAPLPPDDTPSDPAALSTAA